MFYCLKKNTHFSFGTVFKWRLSSLTAVYRTGRIKLQEVNRKGQKCTERFNVFRVSFRISFILRTSERFVPCETVCVQVYSPLSSDQYFQQVMSNILSSTQCFVMVFIKAFNSFSTTMIKQAFKPERFPNSPDDSQFVKVFHRSSCRQLGFLLWWLNILSHETVPQQKAGQWWWNGDAQLPVQQSQRGRGNVQKSVIWFPTVQLSDTPQWLCTVPVELQPQESAQLIIHLF